MALQQENMESFLQFCKPTRIEVLQNASIHNQHRVMKPISSLSNGGTKKNPRYSVHFDDGITIIIKSNNDEFIYDGMLSTGLDSYYLKKRKWPSGKNLDKRMELAIAFVNKNIKNNRYRKKVDDEPER
jgi:hypothetical protein